MADKWIVEKTMPENFNAPESIHQDEHGNYHWTYRMNLLTNPMIAITIMKILLVILLVLGLFLFFLTLGDGFTAAAFLFMQIVGYGFIVSVILLIVGLLLTALILGGPYTVAFTMNEKGIEHKQLTPQYQRAKTAAHITALLGALAGKPSVAGAGLLAGQKQASYSRFQHVKTVKTRRRFHTILVSEALEHNQIYVSPAQYDFVLSYILAHCPNVKRK